MKILFLSPRFYPHIGGVEKHVLEVSKSLIKKGHTVTILTEKYDSELKDKETINGIKVVRFSYPHIKLLGLLFILWQIFLDRKFIQDSNVVHIHDVFIWYLPFRFLFPFKKVYTTFHGWEGVWPIPQKFIFLKRLANKLSDGSIAVGKYIGKYYGIKSDFIIYGGANDNRMSNFNKIKNSLVFVGRLEKDTGLLHFLHNLKIYNSKFKIDFVGDGNLRSECEKYGVVHGFVDPKPFLQKAWYCVPGGYLSYIEAVQNGCKIMTYSDNPLKKDYWEEIQGMPKFPTWSEIADLYLKLWKYEH